VPLNTTLYPSGLIGKNALFARQPMILLIIHFTVAPAIAVIMARTFAALGIVSIHYIMVRLLITM
jgi:hypothetical protein